MTTRLREAAVGGLIVSVGLGIVSDLLFLAAFHHMRGRSATRRQVERRLPGELVPPQAPALHFQLVAWQAQLRAEPAPPEVANDEEDDQDDDDNLDDAHEKPPAT